LGDIARQISAGLRCDPKKLKALQKSHRASQKSARMTPLLASEFHRRRRRGNILVMRAHAILGSFHSRPGIVFPLATSQSASTRPKKHRAERRAPPTVERCLVPPAPGESGTPIILQGLPKRRRGTADDPKGRAERPRTFPRGSSYVCRRFPRRACDSLKLQPALPV
jgi:hypothetical protein